MKDFEARLERLEAIGESLRDGSVHLDKASALFEEGLKLARELESELQKVEKRVEILVNDPGDESLPPTLELFPELHEARNEPPADEE